MLKKFEVTGFKNFSKKYTLDFTDVRDYQFNKECIKDNLLSKMVIYGKNATGKSNIGLALFDIVTHLTEKNITPKIYDNFLNQDTKNEFAEFHYVFFINGNEIDYLYQKTEYRELLFEKIVINDELLFEYNFNHLDGNLDRLKEVLPTLNYEFHDKDISMLRYIVNNSTSGEVMPLKDLMNFVSKMLWSRSLDENRYIGYKTSTKDYLEFITDKKNLNEFISLLEKADINEKLIIKTNSLGKKELYFDKLNPIPFFKAASNGTKALYTFFYWLTTAQDISFLFIDEFDAYYHFELAELIVKILEQYTQFQTILTSHNTNLLTNKIMRPDCYFIITNERITSIANATKRELREGHNLQKLYMSGEFDG